MPYQSVPRFLVTVLFATFFGVLFATFQTADAQPPTRRFDAKGAPEFVRLDAKPGINPPLDVDGNFLIGPKYLPAPERQVIAGVPKGKVVQFTIDSKDTQLLSPGIARKVFGKVDPNNPKTLIVDTHEIDYKRQITVYIPGAARSWQTCAADGHARWPQGQTEDAGAANFGQLDSPKTRATDGVDHDRQRRRRCAGASAWKGIRHDVRCFCGVH